METQMMTTAAPGSSEVSGLESTSRRPESWQSWPGLNEAISAAVANAVSHALAVRVAPASPPVAPVAPAPVEASPATSARDNNPGSLQRITREATREDYDRAVTIIAAAGPDGMQRGPLFRELHRLGLWAVKLTAALIKEGRIHIFAPVGSKSGHRFRLGPRPAPAPVPVPATQPAASRERGPRYTRSIHVKITRSLEDGIAALAKARKETASYVVRSAIRSYIRAKAPR